MQSASDIALAVVVVILVVARQFRARQITGDSRRMLVVPAVLAVLAFRDHNLIDHAHRSASVALLVVSILLEVAMGFAWGFTTRVWQDASGAVWAKGTAATGFAWVGMIIARIGLYAIGSAMGVAAGQGVLLLSLAAVLLVRTAVVSWRAREMSPSYGVPAAG
ncbi:DUF1453 family protein [Streptacidiphilus carbonis]|jgi:hypothetical protein|uniref:DUF1453 family protein n=1 Tax=Streptacidiphilus carbonis TaxID=105422 RepID=UPI0005AA0520|nr:DUF1453 family protein [Streptacidiphilus carbonis]